MPSVCAVYGRSNAAGRVLQLAKRREKDADNKGNVVKVVFSNGDELHEIVRDLDSIRTLEEIESIAAMTYIGPSNLRGTPPEFLEPTVMNTNGTKAAFGIQGAIRNFEELMRELEKGHAVFQVEPKGSKPMQSNVIHYLAQKESGSLEKRVLGALEHIQGGLSLIGMGPKTMVVVQKSLVTPLIMGKRKGGFYFASEASALEAVGVTEVEQIPESKLLRLIGVKTPDLLAIPKIGSNGPYRCSFLSRHDPASVALHLNMTYGRFMQKVGEELARVAPVEGGEDVIVIPIPDSGNDLAIGYARASGLPLQLALRRSHQAFRSHDDDGVFHRTYVVKDLLKRRAVVLDDRLYGGATLCRTNALLRKNGVEMVDIRLGNDPAVYSCLYGVSTMSEGDLLMPKLKLPSFDEKRVCEALSSQGPVAKQFRIQGTFEGPNSCRSLPLAEHLALMNKSQDYCTYCFTGDIPAFDKYSAKR